MKYLILGMNFFLNLIPGNIHDKKAITKIQCLDQNVGHSDENLFLPAPRLYNACLFLCSLPCPSLFISKDNNIYFKHLESFELSSSSKCHMITMLNFIIPVVVVII